MTGDGFEPRSLRRLRESLSNLEQLERQRKEIRDRWDERFCNDYVGLLHDSLGGGVGPNDTLRSMRSTQFPSMSPPRRASPRSYAAPDGGMTEDSTSPCRPPAWATCSSVLGGAMPSGPSRPRSPSPLLSSRVQRVAEEYSSRFQRAAEQYSNAALQRDSALTQALERSQDRIELLKRERDEASALRDQACSRVASQEAEMKRITALMERSEAEQRRLAQERQREVDELRHEAAELERSRREQKEAHDQFTLLQAEARQSRATSEEWRARFERLMKDQRLHIESLEESGKRTMRDLSDQTRHAVEFGEALYTCLHERAALLDFVVDLLTALQSLFYNPTPFTSLEAWVQQQALAGRRSSGSRGRSTSAERQHSHRHSGCYACRWNEKSARLSELRGEADLQELVVALRSEIGAASKEYSMQVQRIASEAEKNAQILGISRNSGAAVDAGAPAGTKSSDHGVFRTCLEWISEDRRRREVQGAPADSLAPFVDWAEERSQYKAATHAMETKFEQLSKLKKVLHAQQQGAVRKGSKGCCS